MSILGKWENKIKEKRMKTSFHDFLKEIMSHYSITLYKRDWMVTSFAPEFAWHIVSPVEFEKLRADYGKLWREYDFGLNFWENYKSLEKCVQYPAIGSWGDNENSQYAHKILHSNNCYISFEVSSSENIMYSVNVKDFCKDIYGSVMVWDHSENIYQSAWVFQSSSVFYSRFIFNSNNIWFSSNLIWCSECLFCNDLENQSYCVNNQKYSEEEYYKMKREMMLIKGKYLEYYDRVKIWKWQLLSEESSWSFLIKTRDVENGYFVYYIHNGRNTMFAGTAEWNVNFFDAASCWSPRGNDYYGVMGAWSWDKYFCSIEVIWWTNNYYSYFLENCSFCLWCIGLKNKQFCILNKQYTKEEWYELADKIFTQMDKDWILGDFFPWELNPFYFNDTVAYLIDDTFSKKDVVRDGYMWRDEEIRVDIPKWAEVVNVEDLDRINYDESILKKVILDKSGNYYRIMKMEYDFLKKHDLPLPEIHWLERIKLGFKF